MSDSVSLTLVSGKLFMPSGGVIRKAVVTGMKAVMFNVEARAKGNATQRPGPRVDTGRLRSSIVGKVTETSDSVTGIVGSKVEYSRILELGGPADVREHTRSQSIAWGRKMKEPRDVRVRAHVVNRRAYPYLRPAIESPITRQDMEAEIGTRVKEALHVS